MKTPLAVLLASVVSCQCVFGAPTITVPPQSRALRVGDHMAFVLSATGSGTLSYQWSKNGGNITGATTTALSFTNLQTTDSGTYTITVNDTSLQPTTANVTLNVSTGLLHLYPTNLVVLHNGDGLAALAATGNTTYLDQFATDGTYISSVMIPDKGSSALLQNNGLTDVYMQALSNNRAVVFGGYNTAKPGPTLGSSTAATVPRGVGMVNGLGYYTLAVAEKNIAFNSQKVAGIGSLDGTQFWLASGNATNSVVYWTNGTDVTVAAGPAGRTSGAIFNNDYYVTLSGGLWHFGGLPTSLSTAQEIFATGNPNDFAISPDGLTIYLTDGSSIQTGVGGVQRWDSNGAGGYTKSYTFNSMPATGTGNNGPDGLAVDFSNFTGGGSGGLGAVIYATTGSGTTNSLIRIADNGPSSTTTILFTFGVNQVGRGLRFAPVADIPSIASQPASTTVTSGRSTTFTVTAAGSAPFSYQWRKGGVALTNGGHIAGALTSTLTVSSAAASDADTYSVIVSNDIGTATSSDATLTFEILDPGVAADPQNVTTNFGAAAVFTVTPTGTAPFTYKWLKGSSQIFDGGNIRGAATSNLTVNPVACADSASYTVIVHNSKGDATSASAVLIVNDPIITSQPTAAYALDGNNAIFTVGAAGTPSLAYQWQKNGANLTDGGNITGSSSASLTVSGISSADTGSYSVSVTSACGSNIVSTVVPLVESTPVGIAFPPQDRTIHAGDNTSFVVLASGTSPYLYQWSQNGANISGATNSYLLIPQAQTGAAGTYSVMVSNLAGTSTSASATLTVSPNPINLYPSNIVVLRAGDGSGALAATGNSLFLDQFTTNGTYLNSISIPDTGASALLGVNGVTDNYMTRSADGSALMIAGFNVAKPYATTLSATTAAAVPRAIGTVNNSGAYTLAFSDTNALFNSVYMKTAASPDGISQFWSVGGAGVVYSSLNLPDVLITNSPGGRYISEIFSNDLYVSLSGGLYHFGGLPTAATQATKLFTSSNPNDFAISPDGQTIYVTDGSNIAQSGGGVQRWDLAGGVWTMTYTYSTPPFLGTGNNGPDGLTVDFSNFAGGGASGFGAVIYGTSGQGQTNSLFQIVDLDGGETPTVLYQFGPNQVGRGIRFGPSASTVVIPPKLSAHASGNTITITWPDTATGFTLESTPSLPASWTATGLPVNDVNGQNTVTDQINGQKYYRLHK